MVVEKGWYILEVEVTYFIIPDSMMFNRDNDVQ